MDITSRELALTASGDGGWRDIASAPKDGTEIGLWMVHPGNDYNPEPFERFSVGAWDEGCTHPMFKRKPGWDAKWIGSPTHWMPLPQPPTQQTPAQSPG